jgi:hypothetical protein
MTPGFFFKQHFTLVSFHLPPDYELAPIFYFLSDIESMHPLDLWVSYCPCPADTTYLCGTVPYHKSCYPKSLFAIRGHLL